MRRLRMRTSQFPVGPALRIRCSVMALRVRTKGMLRERTWLFEVVRVNLLLRVGRDRAD